MKSQILFMMRGGEVSRYHTLRTLQSESVAAHSWGVACFVWLLRPEASARLLMAALAHDMAEQETGDLPAPSKRSLGVSKQFAEYEDRILGEAGFNFELGAEEARILKLADCLQGMMFCVRERSLGNRGVDVVFERYSEYVKERLSDEPAERKALETMKQLWLEAVDGKL